MKIEHAKGRPPGVTTLMSVSGDLGDVLGDTTTRLRNAAIAAAGAYLVGNYALKLTGDKPLWAALAAFGIFLVK